MIALLVLAYLLIGVLVTRVASRRLYFPRDDGFDLVMHGLIVLLWPGVAVWGLLALPLAALGWLAGGSE